MNRFREPNSADMIRGGAAVAGDDVLLVLMTGWSSVVQGCRGYISYCVRAPAFYIAFE